LQKDEKYANIDSSYLSAQLRSRHYGSLRCGSPPADYKPGGKIFRVEETTGKEYFSFREFQRWCRVSMLFYFMTACQPPTARTGDLYPFL